MEIGYRYSHAARGSAVTLIAADGTAFNGNPIRLRRGSVLAGASLTVHKGRWTGFVKISRPDRRQLTDNNAALGFRLAF